MKYERKRERSVEFADQRKKEEEVVVVLNFFSLFLFVSNQFSCKLIDFTTDTIFDMANHETDRIETKKKAKSKQLDPGEYLLLLLVAAAVSCCCLLLLFGIVEDIHVKFSSLRFKFKL